MNMEYKGYVPPHSNKRKIEDTYTFIDMKPNPVQKFTDEEHEIWHKSIAHVSQQINNGNKHQNVIHDFLLI